MGFTKINLLVFDWNIEHYKMMKEPCPWTETESPEHFCACTVFPQHPASPAMWESCDIWSYEEGMLHPLNKSHHSPFLCLPGCLLLTMGGCLLSEMLLAPPCKAEFVHFLSRISAIHTFQETKFAPLSYHQNRKNYLWHPFITSGDLYSWWILLVKHIFAIIS